MAFNGSGTFSRIYNWSQDAANAIPIMSARMDTEDNGFATGLSNCICKDGQTTITADIPLNGHKLTGIATATAAQDGLNLGTGDGRYLKILDTLRVFKSAVTTRNTQVLADDPDLIIPITTAGTYLIRHFASFYQSSAGSDGGLKSELFYTGTWSQNTPFGVTGFAATVAFASQGISAMPAVYMNYSSIDPVAFSDWLLLTGTIFVATAGNLSIRWAQGSVSGRTTALGPGSYLELVRMA